MTHSGCEARRVKRIEHLDHARFKRIGLWRPCRAAVLLLSCAMAWAQTKPQRIVSTAPSITETLFALGIGDRVVGVSQFSNYQPQVQKLPKVGSYIRPDAEAIARLAPDLVILQQQGSSNQLTGRLGALHIAYI